jgi:hypothetical protein
MVPETKGVPLEQMQERLRYRAAIPSATPTAMPAND